MLPPARNAFEAERIRKHGATPVFLIRHGQTLWNKERRFLGRSDIPLNDLGHQQAIKSLMGRAGSWWWWWWR